MKIDGSLFLFWWSHIWYINFQYRIGPRNYQTPRRRSTRRRLWTETTHQIVIHYSFLIKNKKTIIIFFFFVRLIINISFNEDLCTKINSCYYCCCLVAWKFLVEKLILLYSFVYKSICPSTQLISYNRLWNLVCNIL